MKPRVVDSHTHRYPPEVFKDPKGWARARGERHWVSLVAPCRDHPSLQGWADRDRMLADMDAGGVDQAVLLGWYWEHQETCEWHNRWYAQWLREDPDRFAAFASVQPLAGEKALDAVKQAVDWGFCGIGEVLPAVQGFARDHPSWLRVLEFAVENHMCVTLHVTEPVGPSYPGKVATPFADYEWLAQTFPELKLILAHWGGLLPFYELNRTCQRTFRNVYYDTAASPLLYDKRVYRSVVEIVGAEKILFGSDYPLRLYPKEEAQFDFQRLLQEVRTAGLSETQLSAILGGNAQRLLRLNIDDSS